MRDIFVCEVLPVTSSFLKKRWTEKYLFLNFDANDKITNSADGQFRHEEISVTINLFFVFFY